MFERYLSDVLTSYFGQYIEDIHDIETIRISAWRGGAIVLRDVQLRRDCLQRLLSQRQRRRTRPRETQNDDDDARVNSESDPDENDDDDVLFPIEMMYGHIGRLELHIPWKVIRNQFSVSLSTTNANNHHKQSNNNGNHISILLCDVNIVMAPVQAQPRTSSSSSSSSSSTPKRPHATATSTTEVEEHGDPNDVEPQENNHHEQVTQSIHHEQSIQAALDAELLQRMAVSSSSNGVTPSSSSSSSTTSVISKPSWKQRFLERFKAIFSDLSVTIQNIHFRYEDPGYGFAVTNQLPQNEPVVPVEEQVPYNDDQTPRTPPQQNFYYRHDNNLVLSSSPYRTWTNVVPTHEKSRPQYRPAMAIGITLREFTIQQSSVTTGTGTTIPQQQQQYRPKVVIAAAQDVAAYWDSDTEGILTRVDVSSNHEFADAFRRLNTGTTDHSFVLHPFSPSIEFGLLPSLVMTPPSEFDPPANICNTVDVAFPPCRWNISKNLLDDMKYLRKSMSKWQNQPRRRSPMRDIQKMLHPIQHLRPDSRLGRTFDPRQWWYYTYAAVTILIRHDTPTMSHPYVQVSHPQLLIRHGGWIGLVQAVGRRRKYIDLFLNFLEQHDDTVGQMEEYHQELLAMERNLLVDEVKSFRIASYEQIHRVDRNGKLRMWIESLIADQDSDDSSHGGVDSAISASNDLTTRTSLLSSEHRLQMFIEMAAVLHRERMNIELQKKHGGKSQGMGSDVGIEKKTSTSNDDNKLLWKIGLKCVEFSLQVNDTIELYRKQRHRSLKTIPVVRLSCAFCVDQEIFEYGSWKLSTRIGSLFVKDCTVVSTSDDVNNVQSTKFPNLLAMKDSATKTEIQSNDIFDIDGTVHVQIVGIEIKRVKWKVSEEILRSRTETSVRVLPLEIVYSTAPVEALSHILGATNDEFSDDYNRIVNRLSIWKNRQQKRLLNALAHEQKQIYFDIVIGAPVLLVPVGRRLDDSLLILDFGQLHFCSEEGDAGRLDFDNQWLLEITHVQIQSMPVMTYSSLSRTEEMTRHVIEPFSLRFDMFTKIQETDSESVNGKSSMLVLANLPRLALNVNSKDLVHIFHLRKQWAKRTRERRPLAPHVVHSTRQTIDQSQNKQEQDLVPENGGRRLEFRFVAPIFSVRFETKSGRLDKLFEHIPLFDFALKGIEGNIVRAVSTNCTNTTFCAMVQGLIAVDLFQPAGIDYSLLLSSINPEILQGVSSVSSFSDKHLSGDNLVTLEYSSTVDRRDESSIKQGATKDSEQPNRLKVMFHELFVEWNPETIAMISASIWTPKDDACAEKYEAGGDDTHKRNLQSSNNDDEFFDAEEDAFYDAESVASGEEASRLLSEISESERSSISDFNVTHNVGSLPPWTGNNAPLPVFTRSTLPGLPVTPWLRRNPIDTATQKQVKHLVVSVELSKIRVNFNKETRHRRLITAEMDGSKIHYNKMPAGGSKFLFNIGNLTFSDSESVHNNTLYREILGLKTDESGKNGEQFSLLQMEMITKARTRKYVDLDENSDDVATSADLPVFVDSTRGLVHGFDNYFQATLSPMRFVYIQQLWFEIVDYFFTAIVGYEVWGSKTPIPGDRAMLDGRSVGAEAIPFTRFDVVLNSPTILFPVSPCSTDFIRIAASFISLRNWYKIDAFRPPTLFFRDDGESRQWYNNCDIMIEEIEIGSWSGTLLNPGERRSGAKLSLSWPVGPSAPVNVPKWNVSCALDEVNLILDRVDYALLQNVVQHNLGSTPHHMEEWNIFLRLDSTSRIRYNNNILVHFPYDKKDSTPSTFDMTLTAPNISMVLTQGKGRDIAVVRCTELQWKYCKLLDRLSRQNVTCYVDIVDSILGRALLSSDKHDELGPTGAAPKLEYRSCLFPSLSNEKTLLISGACIEIIFQSWMSFSAFFQDLPLPAYLSPNEAIQVGDRWYKIGGPSTDSIIDESSERLNWIRQLGPVATPEIEASRSFPAESTFHFSLINLAVQVRSGLSALILSIEGFDFVQNSGSLATRRAFNFVGVEFQTRQAKVRRSSDYSLIRPWNVEAVMSTSQETKLCACLSHSYDVKADVLYARTAFSDITVALDACMNLLRDIRASTMHLSYGAPSHGGGQSAASRNSKLKTTHNVAPRRSQRISIVWKGVNFVLVDDSGRHFLQDQNLAHISSELVECNWSNCSDAELCSHCEASFDPAAELNMHLQVVGFNIVDCLQSTTSPFREVVSVLSRSSTTNESLSMKSGCNNENKVGFEFWSVVKESKSYGIEFPWITIQYNPSFVVALQRFVGRLAKEIKMKHGDFFQDLTDVVADKSDDKVLRSSTSPSATGTYKLSVSMPNISIILNKEHQGRRLLKMSIAGVLFEYNLCPAHSILKGHIRNLSAMDATGQGCGLSEVVLQSTAGESRFIEFVYVVFFAHKSDEGLSYDLPPWVKQRLIDEETIDDVLDVSVGTYDIVYIKERTAELIDYLSNGMPGKGMGATSRAAKGFVGKRILRWTYANIQVGIPRVLIPSCEGDDLYIEVRLGNLTLQSWIVAQENASQSRLIKVILNGFSICLKEETKIYNESCRRPLMDDLDFQVDIEISDNRLAVCCNLSAVFFRLSYTDYLSLRDTVRNNLSKRSDRLQWDNLERAWAQEFDEMNVEQDESTNNLAKVPVVYSSSARVVRYGQIKGARSGFTCMKTAIKLGSVGLVLRRDDNAHNSASPYDMIGIRGEGLACEFGIKEDGEQWFHLSLSKILAVDLGRMGRLLRCKHTHAMDLQGKDTVGVLVAGYNRVDLNKGKGPDVVDSQLVFKAEREVTTGSISVIIIISFISVTAFVEPTQDLISFVTFKWAKSPVNVATANNRLLIKEVPKPEQSAELSPPVATSFGSKISLRCVSHYARLVFAADELDYQSRCLIVRGLSIANVSFLPNIDEYGAKNYSLVVNMDFQDVSSYMSPALSDIVSIRSEQIPSLVGLLSVGAIELLTQMLVESSNDDLSSPLLLPLTLSIEYEQETKSEEPMRRSLAVSVDPISVLFSNDDLKLVRAIVDGWTLAKKKEKQLYVDQRHFYKVTFTTERLGLGLRKEANRIIVDNIAELKQHDLIRTGDSIFAINGDAMSDAETISLNDMVSRLSCTPRPLQITFLRRPEDQIDDVVGPKKFLEDTSAKMGTDDKINVSIASAIITVVEREVPLLKVAILMTKIACNILRAKGTAIRLEASSGTNIDYYNLKIWGWEPFVDPGVIYLSLSFQDTHQGPQELSIEIGDKEAGFSVNLTDSFIDTVSKFLVWREEASESSTNLYSQNGVSDDTGVTSGREATVDTTTAAFHFAARQKNGVTKTFEFRNRTGVSVAFARQQPRQKNGRTSEVLNYVGEYNGLQHYESSDITVLSNGEDLKFRIDVNSFADKWKSDDHAGRFPSFTAALQTTAGVALEPFENLETSRPCETLLPVLFGMNAPMDLFQTSPVRKWATWSVQHLNERTVVTIGSSVRVISLLSRTVEIGVSANTQHNRVSVMPLGTLREGIQFNLPLWIAMQKQTWNFYVKLDAEFVFTPIFTISPSGVVNLQKRVSGCVECRRSIGTGANAWLEVSLSDDGGMSLVTIDCTISIRNLLPVSIDWEIGQETEPFDGFMDGSGLRSKSLSSGEEVEVLMGNFDAAKVRLCPTKGNFMWSSWMTLSPPVKSVSTSQEKQPVDESGSTAHEDFYAHLYVKDVFHINLPIGLRISTKTNGMDVTVYSDLWCTNCTSLNLVFGLAIQYEKQETMKPLSVGEATLKEISSLFESGELMRNVDMTSRDGLNEMIRIPGQVSSHITEECFEYVEVEGSEVISRWWASENPFSSREHFMGSDDEQCNWIDKTWRVDSFGRTADGWESSADLDPFMANRIFNSSHRYRRRRWSRTRHGMPQHCMVSSVDAFVQLPRDAGPVVRDGKAEHSLQLAIQVNGGRWSQVAAIPRQGSFHGVVRVSKSRWLYGEGESNGADKTVYELCYVVSPLDGDWGLLTRSFIVTSRFLLRNESKVVTFEVKQAGANDASSVIIQPGQTEPFHWGNYHLPELVSIRPVAMINGGCIYKWSGGFDPLLIGHLPLRLRKLSNVPDSNDISHEVNGVTIHSVKVEIEIRPRTGGTGINLAFREEGALGEGALFRIENLSPFPIWFCQDDVLANPTRQYGATDHSDIVNPSNSIVFSLDIPFRQGKYSHRKAAALATLLRVRLALAPLTTRAGIETTKVLSMAIGETVRLNPSKLIILNPEIRQILQDVRILGAVINDGPTRVLKLSLTSQSSSDVQSWPNLNSITWHDDFPFVFKTIVQGAGIAAEMRRSCTLPSESEIKLALQRVEGGLSEVQNENSPESANQESRFRNLIVSVRAAFIGLTVSLVDSAPSEIAVATFKNINALATWDTLRVSDSTIYITVTSLQVDNMVPNSPFPVAVCPFDQGRSDDTALESDAASPLLVVGLSFAPKHKSGILCLKSATIAPRNLAIKVDLAFLVRLQKYYLDLKAHFDNDVGEWGGRLQPPDIDRIVNTLNTASQSGVDRQKIYFGGLTILPCNIKLSVAPARALTPAQAALEGPEIAAIHQAVRKGDVRVDKKSAGILGVKIGSRNKTPLAVVRGLFKSFIVDGFLRLDGASLNFSGVSLRYHTSTTSQLTTALTAHYLASLRQNLPAVLGSLAAFGNPLGLVRGLGEGVGDFVLEPVRGFQRSVQEMDASYLVDGVARGTLSLTRHTVGGFADSAAMIAETFSKNMAVLTLDRKYAQKRDRGEVFREYDDINVASGLGSGVQKLVNGFMEGVTGVVRAPIRGAEKHGLEGFAKGIGKGLLGLLVKPIIGISDGFSDVMIGVKGSVEGGNTGSSQPTQVRPRRALYGREKAIRTFHFTDAAASALMLRTRLASEPYLSHLDLGDRVILLSCKRGVVLGRNCEELLVIKLKQIESVEIRGVTHEDGSIEWGVVIVLDTPNPSGNDVEVIVCKEKSQAEQLYQQLSYGKDVASNP